MAEESEEPLLNGSSGRRGRSRKSGSDALRKMKERKKRNSRFEGPKPIVEDNRRSRSPRSRSPRSKSPRSRSKSPRRDDDGNVSDAGSEVSSAGSDVSITGVFKRHEVIERGVKGEHDLLLGAKESREVRKIELYESNPEAQRDHKENSGNPNGQYVPKRTNAPSWNLAALARRLKNEANADMEYRGLTPEVTVDIDVLRKNRDKLRDDPSTTEMTAMRTGDPINEHFNKDGHRVRILPDPVTNLRFAPVLPDDDEVIDPKFRAVRRRALIDSSGKLRDRPPVLLDVVIKKLVFKEHPKFSHEDYLNATLLANYSDYYRHLKGGYDVHTLTRLNAGYTALETLFNDVQTHNLHDHAHGKNLIDTTVEVVDFLSNTIDYRRAGAENTYRVYKAWEALWKHRKKEFKQSDKSQLYGNTSSIIELKPTESNIKKFKKVLKMVKLLEKIIGSMEDAFLKNQYNVHVLAGNLKRLKQEIKDEIDLGDQDNKTLKDNILRLTKQNVQSSEFLKGKARKEKDRNIRNKLMNEVKRRESVKQEKYKAKLVVNGRTIGSTSVRQLMWPQFALNFEYTFHIEVTSRPKTIEIVLMKQSENILMPTWEAIATMPVGIPGSDANDVSATGVSPNETFVEFSTTTKHFFDKTESKRGSVPDSIAMINAQSRGTIKNKSFYDMYEERHASGCILCAVNWLASLDVQATTEAGTIVAPLPDKDLGNVKNELIGGEIAQGGHKNKEAQVGVNKYSTQEFRRALQGQSRLDPNEPDRVISDIAKSQDKDVTMPDYKMQADIFQLQKKFPEVDFSTSDSRKYKDSARFELLRMRAEVPHLFTGSAPIPMTDAEIKSDNHWRSMLKPSEKSETFEEELQMADFEEQIILKRQKRIQGFLEKVQMLGKGVKRKKHRHTVEAFVKQSALPWFSGVGLDGIGKLFARRRKLRPQPVSRKPVAKIEKINLYVTVSRARNVPYRYDIKGKNTAPLSPSRSYGAQGNDAVRKRQSIYGDGDDDEEDVDPTEPEVVVELAFQNKKIATNVSNSCAPTFYQSLTLPFSPTTTGGSTTALSPDNLLMEKDELVISLFDITRHHQLDYSSSKRSASNEIKCKRFLGKFSIPFTTIYSEKRVDGMFRINAPMVSLGYNYSDDADSVMDGEAKNLTKNLKSKADEATYVTVMATLENLLVPPDKPTYEIRGGEIQQVQKNAIKMVNKYKRKYKDREYMILAPTVEGTMLLITRYIYPQAPPRSPFPPKTEMNSIEECVRFVSLIPFLDDFKIGQTKEAWNPSHDFLQLRAGDEEEHAILLCNYFNYLDVKKDNGYTSYIVIGRGIPEGKTVYVMRQNKRMNKDVTFWNPCTGDGFLAEDDLCTLKVATIVNEDNIWLNISDEERIHRLSFDLTDSNVWKPFFNSKSFSKNDLGTNLGTVQIPELNYKEPDMEFLEAVERQITRTLEDEFRDWRSKRKFSTVPQNIVKKELGDTLIQMEYEANALELKDYPFSRFEHRRAMEKFGAQYKIYGIPLNTTFTDVRTVVDMVEACDFHENPIKGVKFAISVKCFAYPNDVISVWVYVATLEPR